MLDLDRAWARLSQLDLYKGKRLGDYVAQAITQGFVLTSGASSANTPVTFPNGAAILEILGGARPQGAAAAIDYTAGNDLFSVTLQVQQGRYIIGPQAAIASSVLGNGCYPVFPPKELPVPVNSQYVLTTTNLTTTTIQAWITFNCLVPGAVG